MRGEKSSHKMADAANRALDAGPAALPRWAKEIADAVAPSRGYRVSCVRGEFSVSVYPAQARRASQPPRQGIVPPQREPRQEEVHEITDYRFIRALRQTLLTASEKAGQRARRFYALLPKHMVHARSCLVFERRAEQSPRVRSGLAQRPVIALCHPCPPSPAFLEGGGKGGLPWYVYALLPSP